MRSDCNNASALNGHGVGIGRCGFRGEYPGVIEQHGRDFLHPTGKRWPQARKACDQRGKRFRCSVGDLENHSSMNHCLDAMMIGVLHGTRSSGFAH